MHSTDYEYNTITKDHMTRLATIDQSILENNIHVRTFARCLFGNLGSLNIQSHSILVTFCPCKVFKCDYIVKTNKIQWSEEEEHLLTILIKVSQPIPNVVSFSNEID